MADQQEYSEELTLTYESDAERASVGAVGGGLLALQAMVNEVQSAFEENERILIKARPFRRGSLELPLELIVFGTVMIIQEYPLLQKLREVLAEFFDIKSRLRGRPIQVEQGNVIIIDNSPIRVDQITLQCLDPSSAVSELCAKAFRDIEEDSEIRAVRVDSSTTDQPLVRINRAEFPYFHPETRIGEQNLGERDETTRETLIIRQPSFDAELAWRFVWQGVKISAKMQHTEFQDQVAEGREAFVAGDSLDVDLRRVQEYDPSARTHVTKRYYITRVWEHIHIQRAEQGRLFE